MIDVTMWRARKTTTSSERLRCSDCTAKRGQSGRLWRDDVRRPRMTEALSRTSAVSPLARVADHMGVGPAVADSTGKARSGAAGNDDRSPWVAVLRSRNRSGQRGLRAAGDADGAWICL